MFNEANIDSANLANHSTQNSPQNGGALSIAAGKTLSSAALHDLCLLYVEKTAYNGITAEQLALEYFLAQDAITELLRLGYLEGIKQGNQNQNKSVASRYAQGYKLEDSIPREKNNSASGQTGSAH